MPTHSRPQYCNAWMKNHTNHDSKKTSDQTKTTQFHLSAAQELYTRFLARTALRHTLGNQAAQSWIESRSMNERWGMETPILWWLQSTFGNTNIEWNGQHQKYWTYSLYRFSDSDLDGEILHTIFAWSDSAATIYFIAQVCAAFIQEWRLFESGVY